MFSLAEGVGEDVSTLGRAQHKQNVLLPSKYVSGL